MALAVPDASPQTLQSIPSRAEPSSELLSGTETLPDAVTAPVEWTLPLEHLPLPHL